MIARLEGILESIEGNTALLRAEGGLTYEVLLSAFAAGRLGNSIGKKITLQTLHYLESPNQGSTLLPRLAGFLTVEDRRFFDLFTSAKGIGYKRALRAMALPTDQIAAAIADRDLTILRTLPEIGKQTAETLVAALHNKVDKFLSAAAYGPTTTTPGAPAAGPARTLAREALEVLLQLGENRVEAVNWIDEALRDQEKPAGVQELIARVYRLKAR